MEGNIPRRIGLLSVVLFVWGQYTLEAQPRGLTPPPNQEDSTAWEGYFAAWEQEAPADAQLWIDRFNHLFNRSRQTRIALGQLAAREVAYCPSSSVALGNLASWHYGEGRSDEALTYFIRAAEADPNDPMLHYNIGRLYERQGDRQNARKWWTKLLKSPDEAERKEAKKLLQALDDVEKPKN